MPLTIRREQRDWSNAEVAAWRDTFLAAYEVRGRFESLDLIRAYLGPRAAALDALIERGELVEDEDEWIFPSYFDLYGSDGKLQRRSQADRLQDAADKMARGERLADAEYAARHRARRDGIPFPTPRHSDVRPDESDDAATTTITTTTTKTTTNDEPAEDGRPVVDLYEGLYGKRPSDAKERYLRSLAITFGERRACNALSAEHQKDPSPRNICGRMEEGLKRGNTRGGIYQYRASEDVAGQIIRAKEEFIKSKER